MADTPFTYSSIGVSGYSGYSGAFAGTGVSGYGAFFTGTSSLSTGSIYLSAGNVGIGNTTPLSLLTVGATNGIANKLLTVSDHTSPTTSAGANGILVDIYNGGGIYMTQGNASVYGKYEAYNGSLGVGTMSNHPMGLWANNIQWATLNANGTASFASTVNASSSAAAAVTIAGGLATGGAAYTTGLSSVSPSVMVLSGGNVGINTNTPAYNLQVNGSFAASTKSFVINHPTKPNKQLVYGVTEGPEHSVFIRGRSQDKIINLPEYWVNLVDENSVTVQLTPIGKSQNLYVVSADNKQVVIDNSGLFTGKVDYYYFVQAERKDIPKLEVEV